MPKKLKALKYVIITLFNFFHVSAMENTPQENQIGIEIILEKDESDDCLSCMFQQLPTSTDIFNFTSTCKRFHDLERKNLGYLNSVIFIQGLRLQIVKETQNNDIKLKQIKQALIFQENIYCLARSLDVDINQKQRGQITITSKLSAEEIYSILCKLPLKHIVKLPCKAQWIHWIAYAPLFAKTQNLNEAETTNNLTLFEKKGMNKMRYSDVVHTSQSFWEIDLNERIFDHPEAGFLWALFHQIDALTPHRFVVEFIATPNKTPKIKGFDYHNHTSHDTDQHQVWRCYDRAIEAKIPTAQEEYDRIKGQRNI